MTGMEWVAIISAVGVVLNGLLSLHIKSKMELAKQQAESKATADAVAAVANTKKLEEIGKVATATETLSNSNFKRMQDEAAADRKALATANEEIAKVNKEFANLSKTLALVVQANAKPQAMQIDQLPNVTPAGNAPAETKEGEIKVEKLDLVLASKPSEAGDGTKGGKIEVEKLDLELASKPPKEKKP